MRKNIHIPDELAAKIEAVRFDGRYSTETKAIVALLSASVEDIRGKFGFSYLAECPEKGLLKIGYSNDPRQRVKQLCSIEKAECALVAVIYGGMLMEKSAHLLFSEFRQSGEWFSDVKAIRRWFAENPFSVDLEMFEGPKKIAKSIALEADAWDALRELADQNRRGMGAELGLIILAERDRRASAAADANG